MGSGDIVQGEDERRGLDSGRLFPESTLPEWFRGFRQAKGPGMNADFQPVCDTSGLSRVPSPGRKRPRQLGSVTMFVP